MSNAAEATAPVSPLLDSREVASYLKVSESTLSRWRSAETGPPFIKLGGLPRYRLPGRGGLITKPTKSRKERLVPILDPLRPVLKRLCAFKQSDAPLLVGPRGGFLTTGTGSLQTSAFPTSPDTASDTPVPPARRRRSPPPCPRRDPRTCLNRDNTRLPPPR